MYYRVVGKFQTDSDEEVILLNIVSTTLVMGQINGNNRHRVRNVGYLFYALNKNQLDNFPSLLYGDNFLVRVKVVYFVLLLYKHFDFIHFKIVAILFGKCSLKLCRFLAIHRSRSIDKILDVFFYVV